MPKGHLNIPNFKIAFTFTGEYRDSHVRPVCEELLKLGFTKDDIFFDDWHPELYNGINADAVFREIYHNSSECIVVLLSPNYKEKKWTYNVEWQTVRALINEGEDHKICLLDIDNVDISTIEGLSSYRDVSKHVDNMSPAEIANLIYKRYQKRIKPQSKQSRLMTKDEILALEASVGNYEKGEFTQPDNIFIQAAHYIIDNDDLFRQAIIWNFRKGVKYNYLIPSAKSSQDEFCETVIGWYSLFALPLESKDTYASFFNELGELEHTTTYEFSKYWSSDYKKLVESAKTVWDEESQKSQQEKLAIARGKSIDVFLKYLDVYISHLASFPNTTAIYEVRDSSRKQRQWKGLLKTTTKDICEDYVALNAGGTSGAEIETFVTDFKTYFSDTSFESGKLLKNKIRGKLIELYSIE